MANIKRIEEKTGVSYKITVAKGRDSNGKQIRHYTTWTPPQGMGEKRAEKEVQKVALQFETQIEQGFQLDNRQTFLEYARYVIGLKEQGGAKHNTILEYRHLLSRLESTLGRMKLTEIRPQHLNRLYKDLQAPNVRTGEVKARGKGNLAGKLKELGMSRAALSKAAGVAPVTVTHACRGEAINGKKAEAIAAVLDADVKDYFELHKESQPLSGKTVLEYHRFVHTVLAQEVAGLKWSKVDLENGRLEISANLCYSKERGIYETTTKTGNVRFVNIPAETVALLKKYRASQAALRLANGDRWQDTGYLFTQDDGRPMNPTSITAWLNKFSKRRGLPHIHPQSFRHSVASILISAGTDLVTVAGQLGHTQTSTTADIYAHVVEKTKAQAAECIADIMLRGKRA